MNQSNPHEMYRTAAGALGSLQRPLLLAHTKADGDALGSLLAMRGLLRARGADPLAMPFDPTPYRYEAIKRHETMPVWGSDVRETDLAAVDGVVILDTCSYNQLAPLADWLRRSTLPKIVFDHHVTRDDLADLYVIDETAAATAQIIHDFADACGWAMSPEVREAIFIGIATDTGWFRHSNTDARALSTAAALVERGVEPSVIHRYLYQTDSPARIRLLAHILERLELLASDRLAVLSVTQEALRRLGARMSDTEEMINEPMRIAAVRVSVLLAEQDDGQVRVSLRSKPAEARSSVSGSATAGALGGGDPGESGGVGHTRVGGVQVGVVGGCTADAAEVDVSEVAARLGGGGHRRAAAARLRASLTEARERVCAELLPLLGHKG